MESSKPCRDKWQVYFRNLGRNIVEMWEMFDFGHVKSYKDLKDSLQAFKPQTNPPSASPPSSSAQSADSRRLSLPFPLFILYNENPR